MSVQLPECGCDAAKEIADKNCSTSLEPIVIDSEDNEALDSDCLICMDEFVVNDEVIRMSCRHFFHHKCISEWLKDKSSCPLCRQIVDDNPFLGPLDSLPTEDDLQMGSEGTAQFILRGVPNEDLIDAIEPYERLVRQYIYNDSDSDLLSEDETWVNRD